MYRIRTLASAAHRIDRSACPSPAHPTMRLDATAAETVGRAAGLYGLQVTLLAVPHATALLLQSV
eukprot:5655311-Pleurochrysis_carterae.AAC.6